MVSLVGRALVRSMAFRRVSCPGSGLRTSLVVVTRNGLAWVWKAPMSGGLPPGRGNPRWSVVRLAGQAGAEGRAAGKEGHGLEGTAIPAQRRQQRIAADQVVIANRIGDRSSPRCPAD